MIEPGDSLRQQLLISHMAHVTGIGPDEARILLNRHSWQLEPALSAWFSPDNHHPPTSFPMATRLCPTNTPATPPQLMDAMLAMQKLDWQRHPTTITVERRREDIENNGGGGNNGGAEKSTTTSS